jgi:hypothetical protein
MPNLSQLPPPPKGQTGLSFNDLKNLPPPPSGQQGLSLDQINQTPPTPDSVINNANTKQSGVAPKIAQTLGISKFGQGIATAGRVASGSINQTGDENAQSAKDTTAVTNALHQLILKGVPANDLRRLQLVNYLKNTQGDQNQTQAQIDPGTQLSNKEVLGSAANTALLATAPGLPSGGSTLAGKVAAGGALGYASDVAQSANENKQSIFKPGLGTAIGVGLPIVAKVGGAIFKTITGATTGAGKDVIQRAIDSPEQVNAAINKYAQTPEAKQQLVDSAKDSINQYLKDRNSQFGEGLSKMVASEPISKQIVLDSFAQSVDKFGGQIQDGALTFGDTALNSAEQKSVTDVFDTVKNWKDVTPQGMDTLRQRIGNEMSNFKFANNGRDSVILGGVKQDLTQLMKDKIPGYGDMLSTYGSQTQTAKDLAAELSLKSSNAKPATQLGQIMKLFKKDPVVVENLTKTMGQESANKFLNDVSGAILSSWLPQQGLVGKIAEGTAGVGAIAGLATGAVNPLTVAVGAAASSPRIVGKAAVGAGKLIQSGAGTALKKAATIAGSKIKP